MPPTWEIHGYAIACEAGHIADSSGGLPKALMNEADWAYFQAGLDASDLCILGRASHEATPNAKNRLRVVMSTKAKGLTQQDPNTWAWNPADLPADAMLAQLLPRGGRVAIPGGGGPFTYFLDLFDAFHLSRKAGIRLEGGRPVFTLQTILGSPEAALTAAGFHAAETRDIDPEDGVTLTIWRRPDGPDADALRAALSAIGDLK